MWEVTRLLSAHGKVKEVIKSNECLSGNVSRGGGSSRDGNVTLSPELSQNLPSTEERPPDPDNIAAPRLSSG